GLPALDQARPDLQPVLEPAQRRVAVHALLDDRADAVAAPAVGPLHGAAVLAGAEPFVRRDIRALGQALVHRRQLAALHELGERGRLLVFARGGDRRGGGLRRGGNDVGRGRLSGGAGSGW